MVEHLREFKEKGNHVQTKSLSDNFLLFSENYLWRSMKGYSEQMNWKILFKKFHVQRDLGTHLVIASCPQNYLKLMSLKGLFL